MPIFEAEWASIRTLVERVVAERAGRKDSYFITSKVIKRDENKKVVWLAEFGDQPIPVVGFDHEVKYYDTQWNGTVNVTVPRTVKIKVLVPKVGEVVLVAREMGSSRLPRCLGVIQGKDWLVAEVE